LRQFGVLRPSGVLRERTAINQKSYKFLSRSAPVVSICDSQPLASESLPYSAPGVFVFIPNKQQAVGNLSVYLIY
jgi:hypothetical protein